MGFLEPIQVGYETFSQGGAISLIIGVFILILSNALAYLIERTFKLKPYYGRFLAGIIILFFTMMLSLSTDASFRFRTSALFGIGEIIIGALDVINNRLNTTLPLLIPDPGCQQ